MDLVLSQKQDDLVLNMLVFQSFQNGFTMILAEFLPQSFSNFTTNLFHDFHIRSFCNLGGHFHCMSMIRDALNFGLCNLLIENLFVELFGIVIDQIVLKFSTFWLDHITLTW